MTPLFQYDPINPLTTCGLTVYCHVLFQPCGLTRSRQGKKEFKESIFLEENVAYKGGAVIFLGLLLVTSLLILFMVLL